MASTSTSSDQPAVLRLEFGKPGGCLWPADRRTADRFGYAAMDGSLGLPDTLREQMADLENRHAMLRKGRPTPATLNAFRADTEAVRAALADHLGADYRVLTGPI